jgi:hypothetical protein
MRRAPSDAAACTPGSPFRYHETDTGCRSAATSNNAALGPRRQPDALRQRPLTVLVQHRARSARVRATDILVDGHDAFVFELLRRVVTQRVHVLRRSGRRMS